MNKTFRIAFIAGKLGDVDGVSLEVEKWINILQKEGHEIFAIAGKFADNMHSVPKEKRLTLEEISFDSELQHKYELMVFPYLSTFKTYQSKVQLKTMVEEMNHKGCFIADIMFNFIQNNSIDVIVSQNTNAMPMTIIGGLAVYKLCTEKRVATIFHHHDFWWERSRFVNSAIEKTLLKTMPPRIPGIEHVVLSKYAAHILRSIKRVHPRIIPNCEDFDNPVFIDDYNSDFRQELGFKKDDILVLQPTRIVKRKRIEDSIHFAGKLGLRYPEIRKRLHFVISLYQGDEPDSEYISLIRDTAKKYDLPLHLISDRVSASRGEDKQGRKLYTNRDVLAHADFATYLPIWEGFGNALLEGIAARVPMVCSTYLVYKTDIRIHDFDIIEVVDDYDENNNLIIPDFALDRIYKVLTDKDAKNKMIEKNFNTAKAHFGYDTLRHLLIELFEDYTYEILASRKKIKESREEFSV